MSRVSLPDGIAVFEPAPSDRRMVVVVQGQHAPAKALRAALLALDRSVDLKRGTVAINPRQVEAAWEILGGELALAYRDYVTNPPAPRPSRNPWSWLSPSREYDEECRAALRELGATWDRERGEWKIRQSKAEAAQALIDAANARRDEAAAEARRERERQAREDEAADPVVSVGSASRRDETLREQLRALGAAWDRNSSSWYIRQGRADQARALIAEVEARLQAEALAKFDATRERLAAEAAALAERRQGQRKFRAGSGGWYGGRTHGFTEGERLQAEDGTWWVVTEASGWYVPDGESSVVGGHPIDEGGYAYEAWASPAPAEVVAEEQARVEAERQAREDGQALSTLTRVLWASGERVEETQVPSGLTALHAEADWTVYGGCQHIYVHHLLGVGDDSPWGYQRVERTAELDDRLVADAQRAGQVIALPERGLAPTAEVELSALEAAWAQGQAWDGPSVWGNAAPTGLAPEDRRMTFAEPVRGWFGTLRADGSVILTRWDQSRSQHRLITANAAAGLPPHTAAPPTDWVILPQDAIHLEGARWGRQWVRLVDGELEWLDGPYIWGPSDGGQWSLNLDGGAGHWLTHVMTSGEPWAERLLARILREALDQAPPTALTELQPGEYRPLDAPLGAEWIGASSSVVDGRLVKRRVCRLTWADGGVEHLIDEAVPGSDPPVARVYYGDPEDLRDTHGPLADLVQVACSCGHRRDLARPLANSGKAIFVGEEIGPCPYADLVAPWEIEKYRPRTTRYRVQDYDGTARVVDVEIIRQYDGPEDGDTVRMRVVKIDGEEL